MMDILLGGMDWSAGRLAWTAPVGVFTGALLVVLIILAMSWFSARGTAGRALQTLLLVPALLVLVWAAGGPTWVEARGHREQGRFVILVDDSRSMSVEENGRPRGEEVVPLMDALERNGAEWFLFGRDLRPGKDVSFQDEGTDLARALQSIQDRYVGERLAGIAVVSDGLDRSGLRTDWKAGLGIPDLELSGPLTVYAVGRPMALTDLSVEEVTTGGFAFIRAPFTLTATLKGAGFAGRKVVATLKRDGDLEARQTVTLDAEGLARVEFQVTPNRVGRFTYEVSVPVSEDDAVPSNNEYSVVVRVVRDRMRVLQVCGAPSNDQKFLRLFLKQDPAVDLVSFFIMRTEQDMGAGYDQDELSLIPFPYEQLFSKDLDSFDLIIFQNFDYQPYFGGRARELLDNIAAYVKNGGAFAMLGGDRSFDLGRYAGTPIADILPLALGVTGDPVDLGAFSPLLTSAGKLHPVTALAPDAVESEAIWTRLAPLDGMNLNTGAVPGAAVLLQHPSLRTDKGKPMPVLAVREVGKGRSLALASDASWRWSFAEAARGHGNQAYLRFWKQAMRWLVGDSDAQQVTVETSQENYPVGDEVRVVVRVRDVGFLPLSGLKVRGRGEGPSFEGGEDLVNLGRFEGLSSLEGEVVARLPALRSGAHRARVEVLSKDGRIIFTGSTAYAVSARPVELEDIVPDPAFLKALAEVGGGGFHGPGDYTPPQVDPDAGRWVDEDREIPLWNLPIIPLFIGIFGSLSWWVRRRGGAR